MPKIVKFSIVIVLVMATSAAFARDKKDKKNAGQQAPAREAVSTKDAPPAIGPYSQAIKAGGFVFVSGTTARDPATNKLIDGDISAQTDHVLKNISATLIAAGSSMDKVVKTTVLLKDISDFAKMNEVYAAYFKGAPPARTTIGVAGLPGGALVGIDVVALQ